MTLRQAALFAVPALLLCAVAVLWPAPQEAGVSAALQAALEEAPEERIKVWVHFAPRALEPAELQAALAAADAALDDRARARRARMAWSGDLLVDERDLPLDPTRLDQCRATGAVEVHRSRWLNAASFRADQDEVARLARVPGVRAVTRVGGTRPAAIPQPVDVPQPLPRRAVDGWDKAAAIDYGTNLAPMQQINVPPVHALDLSGDGVIIGVLDTGFETVHEAFADLPVLAVWDFVNDDAVVANETGDPVSSRNHGTMVLSAITGHAEGQLVAPAYGASVVLAKTEDIAVEVPLEEDNWVAGLEWAESLGASLVSSSLGYVDWYDAADLDGNTAITTIAADLAVARGLLVVNSAGNDRTSTGHLIAPADGDSVLTVGAVDATGSTTWFSSPGPTADGRIKPDVAALGQSTPAADPNDPSGYVTASGTSLSTPLVSGVAALMLQRVPTLTPLQVIDALRGSASQAATPDNDQGWGIVDAMGAVTWYGPVISYQPLPEVTSDAGPLVLGAVVTDRLGLAPGQPVLNYRVDFGPWQDVPMSAAGPDSFAGAIPAQPYMVQVDYYVSAASSNGVATSFPYPGAATPHTVFVSETTGVGDDRLPTATRLEANVPNPFNPRTEVRFVLAGAGRTVVEVHDLRGRLVRRLVDSDLPAGPHSATWDGKDDAGRGLPSGTYLVRLRAGGEQQQQKMQLVR